MELQAKGALLNWNTRYAHPDRNQMILADWSTYRPLFVKVFPTEYRRVLGQMIKEDELTEREEKVFE